MVYGRTSQSERSDLVQTFYTHENLSANAKVLDSKRLNKQLLEGRQLLDVLSKPDRTPEGKVVPWSHHPAALMWKGAEQYLFQYLKAVVVEMESRGIEYKKNAHAIYQIMERYDSELIAPFWMKDDIARQRVIHTHRANLYNKMPEHYKQFKHESSSYRKYVCCDRCNYYWPTHNMEK